MICPVAINRGNKRALEYYIKEIEKETRQAIKDKKALKLFEEYARLVNERLKQQEAPNAR